MGDYRYEFYLPEEFIGEPIDQQSYWFVGINITSDYEVYRWDSINTVWDLVHTGAVNPGDIHLFIGEPFGTVYRILSTGPLYLVVTSSEGSFMNLADSNTGSGKGTDFVFIGDIKGQLGVNKLAVFGVEDGGTNVNVEYYNFSNQAMIGTDFAGPLQKGECAFFEFNSGALGVETVLVKVTSDRPIVGYKCTIDDDEIDIAISEEGNRTGQTFYFPLVHVNGFVPIFHVYNKEDFPVSAELYDITSSPHVYLAGVSDIPPRSMGAFTASFEDGDKAFKLNATGNVGVLFGAGFPTEHDQYDSDGIGGGGVGPGLIDSYWEYPPLNNHSTLYTVPVLYGYNDMPLDRRFQYLCSGAEDTFISIRPPLAFLSPTVLVNEFEYISTTDNSLGITSSGSGTITGLGATLDGGPWGIEGDNIKLPAGRHTLQLSATMSGQAFIGIDAINMTRRSTLVWRLFTITANETTDFGHASIYGEIQWTYESDRSFAFYAGGSGNCWLTNIEMVQVPESTRTTTLDPPNLYDRIAENGEDVVLYWIDPNDQYDIAYYLIYSAFTQISFDFSGPPLYNTSEDPDPKRLFWTDIGAASIIGEKYYIVRAVSRHGIMSTTSNTVGKWTKDFGGAPFPPPSYTPVSSAASERSVVSGTITDIANMQDWDDGGSSGILKEDAEPGSENAIFNGEFHGNIEGWERNIIMGDKGGRSSYDGGANAPKGTGGSMVGSASNLFGPVEFMEYRSQIMSSQIADTDLVLLSFWWKKYYSALGVDEQTIYIEIKKPSGTTAMIWWESSVLDDNTWYYFENDVSFFFDEIGIYEIRLGWHFFGHNAAQISAWFDEVVLNVTGTFTTVYRMDIAINNTVPGGGDGCDLEIQGSTTNEPFEVQVWNGTAWNVIGEISSVTTTTLIRHRILSDEMASGKVTVRYLDTDYLFDKFQDILYIDYQRVVNWTKRKTTFSLPLEPFDTRTVDWYANSIPYTCYIRWANGGAGPDGSWVRHDWDMGLGVNDTPVIVGKSYEIACGGGIYTFVGSPAANIRYTEGHLPAPGNFGSNVDQSTGVVKLWWDPVNSPKLDRYLIYKTTTRMKLNDMTISYYAFTTSTIWEDPIPLQDDTRYYYSVVSVKLNMSVGFNTTYSLGVWTRNYVQGYDTLALPLKLNATHPIDWYCDETPNTWGINYHSYSEQRWMWHKTIMPQGAYDTDVLMGEGYQISTTTNTKYIFIGI
ncbi:MAG: hypothetical protein JSV09_16020 [Thermoplasmata archaeon]|nr:MAG: hypothetical protein JSV09_16020 [Thermoplasmata archaeon]